MPLLFKAHPHLPQNKKLALVRLKHLKRKSDKDAKFKHDYVRFMEGVFKESDAFSFNVSVAAGVWPRNPNMGVATRAVCDAPPPASDW